MRHRDSQICAADIDGHDDEPYDNGYDDDGPDYYCPECGAPEDDEHDWDCSYLDEDDE